jgi:hypothetical protein
MRPGDDQRRAGSLPDDDLAVADRHVGVGAPDVVTEADLHGPAL